MTEEGRNREWLLHSGGLMVGLSHRDGGENIHISWPFLNFNVLKWFVAVILHLRQRQNNRKKPDEYDAGFSIINFGTNRLNKRSQMYGKGSGGGRRNMHVLYPLQKPQFF